MDLNFGRTVLIKALVGSHNYNLNTVDSDRDWKFFVMPTFDDLYDKVMFSKARESDNLDYQTHDIRRLSELLWKANINFVEVLFSRDVHIDSRIDWVFDNAVQLSGMNLPQMRTTLMGMNHTKMANLLKGTAKTKHLVEKFGYDTKEACHALRVLLVLERVMETGSVRQAIWFDNDESDRQLLIDIKSGLFSLTEFTNLVKLWKRVNEHNVNKWFNSQKEDVDIKMALDNFIRDLVREGLT